MMSTNNILSPANGKPIIVPSQDIVLGLYHISLEREERPGMALKIDNIAPLQPNDRDDPKGYERRVQNTLERLLRAGSLIAYAPGEKPSQTAKEDTKHLVNRISNGRVTLHRNVLIPPPPELEQIDREDAEKVVDEFTAALERGDLRAFSVENLGGPFPWKTINELRDAVTAERAVVYPTPSFNTVGEIVQAIEGKSISLHAPIKARYGESNGKAVPRVTTTPGRMLLSEILPRHPAISFDLINTLLTKKEVSNLIDQVYRHSGQKETVIFCDHLMTLGFQQACRAGISFGKNDLIIPEAKRRLVADAQEQVKQYEQQYQDGLITQGEKYNKVVDVWSRCTDKVAEEMLKMIRSAAPGEPVNSVWMMSDLGARGSAAQIKQLAGMRGLMAKPSGEIIETPIISNFKEGLTVLEYFNSTHGARKGLADTALKTANSGYLTRRLVDVAQDAIITEDDCGTTRGLMTSAVVDGGELITPLADRILGRTAAVDILDPATGEVVLAAGALIDEDAVDQIERAGVDAVSIRSVLTCESRVGVCGKCYGRDLARGTVVNMGEAVGVIAAQSIGEPGTQLTMRTFHIGGAAQRGAEQSSVEAAFDAVVKVENRNVVINSAGVPVVMGRNCDIVLLDDAGRERRGTASPTGPGWSPTRVAMLHRASGSPNGIRIRSRSSPSAMASHTMST